MSTQSLWWRFWHSWSMRVVLLAIRRDGRCRSSDRWEAGALVAALLISVASVPLAILTGMTAMDRSLTTIRQQAADRHQTVATVVSVARSGTSPYLALTAVNLRYQDSEGRLLKGSEKLMNVPAVGSHLRVWISTDGRIATAPLSRSQAESQAYVVAVAFLVGVLLLDGGFLVAVRGVLLRIRTRNLDTEWAAVVSRPRS